jgi:hypothetical protein
MGCVKRSGVLCGVSCKLMTNYDNERMKVIVGGTQCRIQTRTRIRNPRRAQRLVTQKPRTDSETMASARSNHKTLE